MRASKLLLMILALVTILTACQADEAGAPGSPETPRDTTTTTTTPPTTPPTTPTTPPTTIPLQPVAYLPDEEPALYQAWNGDNGLVARTEPGTRGEVAHRFGSTARDIETTGERAEVDGVVWAEVKLSGSTTGWVEADLLVHQIEELPSHRPAKYVVTDLPSGDKLNVRAEAGADHRIVSTLAEETVVKATGRRAEVQGAIWVEVEYTAGKTGWVSFRYLTPEVIQLADDTPDMYQVTGLDGNNRLNVRKGAGVHQAVAATLAADAKDIRSTGNRAEVAGAVWREIELPNGTTGWVNASYLEVQPQPICRPGGDTFCPDIEISRGMAAAFLARSLGLTDDGGRDWFWDDNGSPFEAEINRLAAAGILQGCDPADPGKVCDEQPATRRMVAAMLSRALGLTDDGSKDWFSDDNGLPFEAEINRLAAAGIAQACNSAGEFCPTEPMERGQIAAWLDRAFDLPATTEDFWADDNGSLFEDAINRITAAGIAYR